MFKLIILLFTLSAIVSAVDLPSRKHLNLAAIKTMVHLAPVMVDGTGMCGSCRVTVGGAMRFACVDGPDFDGHKVDFKELLQRQKRFKTQEARASDDYGSINMLQKNLAFHLSGHVLHSMFWENLSPDGGELWFGWQGGAIKVYSFAEGKVIAELPLTSTATNLKIVFSGDGKALFDSIIKGTDAPRNLDLDVTDVRDLEILVDFGNNVDIADHLDLGGANGDGAPDRFRSFCDDDDGKVTTLFAA